MVHSPDPQADAAALQCIWRRLEARLAQWDGDWRERIGIAEPVPPPPVLSGANALTDRVAFEAFAVALLSGNTRWDRIEGVRGALAQPFDGFDPARFAARDDVWIVEHVVPWFRERRAGSAGLRAGLLRLRDTARVLAGGGDHASAAEFLAAAFAAADGSPERVAMLLGGSKDWKLPGFGIALAAEALRMLHFDLSKPDRHVTRAVGSWGLVEFARWDRKGAFTPPQARPPELLATMFAVRALAEANRLPVTRASSAIWTAGAVSGARLTNAEFAALAS